MFVHQLLANLALNATLLLMFSVPLVLLAFRSLLRQREERLSVRTPTRVASRHRLNQ